MQTDPLVPWLQAEVARVLKVSPDEVTPHVELVDLGIDSLAAVQLSGALAEKIGRDVDPTLMYDCPTIDMIVARLNQP